jgi:glutamine amidotransferase
MIAIIDYGGGNIGSVKNALDFLSIDSIITDRAEEIRKADMIILPGQGRFGDVMKKLRERKIDRIMIDEIKSGKPYLGICIGLQILFEKGEEDPKIKGLGLLKGTVPKFRINLKIPQIGWNNTEQKKESRFNVNQKCYYFVHSYFVKPKEKKIILASSRYVDEFACAIEKDNILAVQFHPEKSGNDGLELLKEWCRC